MAFNDVCVKAFVKVRTFLGTVCAKKTMVSALWKIGEKLTVLGDNKHKGDMSRLRLK